ncbi:MAG: amidohydrolase family protein [Gemmatimonadetes bacterium]|nr:amidohydrolase family protein [Gemmatimonadota bacterium]
MRTESTAVQRRRAWLAGAMALALNAAGAAGQAAVGTEGTFLIRGGSVWASSGQTTRADVLIQDGRIAAVGPAVNAPAGAVVVDAAGKTVYPGMWDAYTPIGLAEISGIATMNLVSEIGDFNPHNRAIVALNVETEMMAITRSNGVTNVITAPSGGVISGQAAAIHLSGWTWEDMAARMSAAYMIHYPRAGGGGRGGFGPAPSQQQQQQAEERTAAAVKALKDMLRLAASYDAARRAGSNDFDLKLEAMRPLVRGETLAIVSADSEEQIRGAIALADTFSLRIAVLGGDEAWKVAELLATKNVPVILGSLQSTPAQDAPYDALYAQPGVLHRAGVKFAFSTGGVANARHVPYHAALATAYGLPPAAAMNALTLWPAQIFGLDNELGSVEPGKIGNVFVADGDPLDVRTTVHEVFIKGRRVPIDDRHTRLYEKWNSRPIRR